MSTTPVETWQNVDGEAIGAIYPFVGAEGILAIALLVLWLLWHVMQLRQEKRSIAEEQALLAKNGNLERVSKGDNLLL